VTAARQNFLPWAHPSSSSAIRPVLSLVLAAGHVSVWTGRRRPTLAHLGPRLTVEPRERSDDVPPAAFPLFGLDGHGRTPGVVQCSLFAKGARWNGSGERKLQLQIKKCSVGRCRRRRSADEQEVISAASVCLTGSEPDETADAKPKGRIVKRARTPEDTALDRCLPSPPPTYQHLVLHLSSRRRLAGACDRPRRVQHRPTTKHRPRPLYRRLLSSPSPSSSQPTNS
jgi:hypothetical protein